MSKKLFPIPIEAINPSSLKGFEKFDDGSILLDVFQLDTLEKGKRQALHDIVTYKPANRIIIYGRDPMTFIEHLVNELLMDEYGSSKLTYNGFNILELHCGRNVDQLSRWVDTKGEHYQYYMLLMKNTSYVNSKVIKNIVRDNDIDLIIHNPSWDIEAGDDIERLTPDYINALESAVEHCNIPIVGVIESIEVPDELYEFADVIIDTHRPIEEGPKLYVLCEKPKKSIFDPFFLYEDGSFVYEKDLQNSDIMNSIDKSVVHPEE